MKCSDICQPKNIMELKRMQLKRTQCKNDEKRNRMNKDSSCACVKTNSDWLKHKPHFEAGKQARKQFYKAV